MEAPRPAVRYQRLQDSDTEEPQVTVQLHSRSARWYIREQQRQTCVRIFAALLLLALALAFAFYELNYGGVDKSDSEEAKWASVASILNKTWDGGFGGHQSGQKTMTSNYDEEEEVDHHHDQEGEPGHYHGGEEDSPHHDAKGEAGHSREDGEQSDQSAKGHTHEPGVYQHATVITASETCSKIGKDVLAAGGNIVDAGIAALLCLCVVHPHAAGIGGVFSALYYNSTAGSARALNAMYPHSPSSRFGVPLVLQGLCLLHQQYGVMQWSSLFTRPVQLALEGFHIDGILARALKESKDQVMSSSLRYMFCYTNGSLKEEGVKVTNRKLARALQAAASSMKNKILPESVVESLSEDLLSEGFSPDTTTYLESLKSSAVAFESSLSIELDGFRLYGAPPPASGNIIFDILKEINRTKLTRKSTDNIQSTVDHYLHVLNASKHGYIHGLADALHSSTDTPSQQTVSTKDLAHLKFAPVGSHISVADSHGSMILISASLNSSFGSKFSSPSTGILLSDFVANTTSNSFFWACPVVIQRNEEEDVLGFGATGGVSIPSAVAQSIIDYIYFEKPLKDIVSGPVLNVNVGEDGDFHTFISGISNTSSVFLDLLDRAENITELSTTDMAIPVLLVESRAEHVRVFHTPPTSCYFDGF